MTSGYDMALTQINFVRQNCPTANVKDIIIRAITGYADDEEDVVFTSHQLRELFALAENTPESGNSTGA